MTLLEPCSRIWMLKVRFGSKFKKDYKKVGKQGRDIAKLKALMEMIQHQKELDDCFANHALIGNWKGTWECHLAPDWLLIYRIEGDTVIFIRTGSHSEIL